MAGRTRTRIPGLDGIRAIATLLVLIFHLVPGIGHGGFAGVDMFFVLSGFLITSLLIARGRPHARSYLHFWKRRFRRLVPAVVVATIGSTALALLVGGDGLVALPRQVVGALTATYNWVEIGAGSSYFMESSPLLLTNMWSLAVEQQFYLFWPLVIALIFPWKKVPQVGLVLVLGTASVCWFLATSADNMSRAYMGTDTHLWGLMIGAGLALGLPRASETRQPARGYRFWAFLGWVGLLSAISICFVAPVEAMYPWGMIGVSLATAASVRAMLPDVAQWGAGRILPRILNSPGFVWFGERSYGIYLWHWPLWVLLFYSNPLLNPYLAALIVLTCSVICADLSYRYVETPIRTHGLGMWLTGLFRTINQSRPAGAIAAVTAGLLVVGCSVSALVVSPATSSAEDAVRHGGDSHVVITGEATPQPTPSPDTKPPVAPEKDTDTERPTETPDPTPHLTDEPAPTATEEPLGPDLSIPASPIPGEKITMVGDSLTIAASGHLQAALPGMYIDAQESRSIGVAPGILQTLANSGHLRDVVIIALATNGTITPGDTEKILSIIGPDRQLIYVTGFGPPRTTWIPEANDEIRRAAATYPNVHTADWNSRITGHTELLAGDSVHPHNSDGLDMYVGSITEALANM